VDNFELLRNGVLLDTGPLLLMAFYGYKQGRYLSKIGADIPAQDLKGVCETIQAILSFVPRSVVTSYVLAEFHSLARARGSLDRSGIISLMSDNIEFFYKLDEFPVAKADVLSMKIDRCLHLCFTDTSLMIAALETSMPVLTLDRELRQYCNTQGIPSLHLYYECYLC